MTNKNGRKTTLVDKSARRTQSQVTSAICHQTKGRKKGEERRKKKAWATFKFPTENVNFIVSNGKSFTDSSPKSLS
jgi:hypothetical protein